MFVVDLIWLCPTSRYVQGGKNAGVLATVWVNLHNLEVTLAGDTAPDYIIKNIGELPGLLRELKVDLGSNA